MSLFYPGAPKSTVSLWECFDQRMNGADFKGSDNFQLSCTLFIPPTAPSIPLSLVSSLPPWKQNKRDGQFVFGERVWKDNLLSKSNKPVSTLPMPPHPFLLSFLVLFSLFLSLWSLFVHLYSHTCHFNFCVEKTSHFLCCLSLSLSLRFSLFFSSL